MLKLLSIVVMGFFLGMRHATDPDHVIAISTIVTRHSGTRRAALIGLLWGLGHAVTIFAVGAPIILFNIVIPNRLGLSMELFVGLMLILLGAWNLRDFLRATPQASTSSTMLPILHFEPQIYDHYFQPHCHWDSPDSLAHAPQQPPAWQLERRLGKVGIHLLRPLIAGFVHGLAGSAAVALLVLASIRNPAWGIAYLLIFGFGTIAGMMLITMSIASTLQYAGSRFQQFNRNLAVVSGLISVAFGLFLAYQICVTQGLLSAHPGAGGNNPPSADGSWTVVSAKTEGISPGFVMTDDNGDRYFVKFDPMSNPEMATGAEMIAARFFHALGYRVPDYLQGVGWG